MKSFTKIIGLACALVTGTAQAIPTLYFDGGISYDASGELSVTASLTETVDIFPAPTLLNSSMVFAAFLNTVETVSDPGCTFFCATSTRGNFVGHANPAVNDLEIYDGNSPTPTLLLSAKFTSLSLEGANGGNTGAVIGLLSSTGGSLQSMFDDSDLFALQLGLSTSFASSMFDQQGGFTGMVDGNIKGHTVPEPTQLALLSLGILLIGFTKRKNAK